MMTGAVIAPPEQRSGMVLAHLLGALFGVLGTLIYWIVNKDKPHIPFVQDQAREALNFQLNILGLMVVACALILVYIGMFLVPLISLTALVLSVIAAVKANAGESFRYPLIIRLIQ